MDNSSEVSYTSSAPPPLAACNLLGSISAAKILQLNNDHNKLKDEIEINQKNYEKLIDEAADEISSFVDKANLEKLS